MFISSAPETLKLIADNIYQIVIMIVLLSLQSILMWLKNKKPKEEQKVVAQGLQVTLQSVSEKLDQQQKDISEMKKEFDFNGGSTVKGMVGNMRNEVSTLKKDMKGLMTQQRVREEAILNLSRECLFICNKDGEVIFANEACKQLFGMTDMHGYEWMRAISTQKQRHEIKKSLDDSVREKIVFREDFEIINQLNKEFKASVTMTIHAIWDDEDNFVQFNGIIKVKNL